MQILCVAFCANLRQRLRTALLHSRHRLRILQLYDYAIIQIICFNNNIRKALARFHIRAHQPVCLSCQQAYQKHVIVIFSFLIPALSIKNADGIAESPVQKQLYRLAVTHGESLPKALQLLRVGKNLLFKPFLNLQLVHLANLLIRNHQLKRAILCHTLLRKITGCKKYAPKIIYAAVYFIIGQFQADMLFYSLACNQTLQLITRRFIGHLYEELHQSIATGIYPISLWFCRRIAAEHINMVYNIPRTINISITKAVAVIPRLGFLKMVCKIISRQKLLHLSIRKAKLLIKTVIGNRKHLKII